MNKKTAFLILSTIAFCTMELMALSTPSYRVFIWNKRDESIYLDFVVRPELEVEVNGIKTFSFESICENLDISLYYLGDDRQIGIKPMKQQICYWFNQYYSVQLWFKSLGPYEQFKNIYQEFTIKNEKGEVLLDMTTLSPESFEKDSRGTDDYYLIINKDNAKTYEIFDESKFEVHNKMFRAADKGIVLKRDEEPTYFNEYDADIITEKVFKNSVSGNEIYYTGANYRGPGIFWINDGGRKTIILETHIRYGPRIIWHDGYTVEICIPTGSPFTHSYFYDFEKGILSDRYDFPVYYDPDYKVLLIWGEQDFELYDIKTNLLINQYNHRRNHRMTSFWPYINYYIEKEEAKITMYYDDWVNNKKGKMEIDITGRIPYPDTAVYHE